VTATPRTPAAGDDEQLIAGVAGAQRAAINLLNMVGGNSAYDDAELDACATDAAEALHLLLDLKSAHDDDDAALFCALERWLP
jgi:hypothetical protein